MNAPADCSLYEAAIADLSDRTLPPEEEAALRAHLSACGGCAAVLAEAERGRGWARLLRASPPMPPPDLLGKVLARTPAALPGLEAGVAIPHPAFLPSQPFAHPQGARMLLTATMAVFSLALTMSVSGLRPRDLAPSHVEAAASRSFYGAKKQVVSFYDNLRVLRELESTVEALRKPAPPAPSARREPAGSLLARREPAASLPAREGAAPVSSSPERTRL